MPEFSVRYRSAAQHARVGDAGVLAYPVKSLRIHRGP